MASLYTQLKNLRQEECCALVYNGNDVSGNLGTQVDLSNLGVAWGCIYLMGPKLKVLLQKNTISVNIYVVMKLLFSMFDVRIANVFLAQEYEEG
jgi:hypothetical protein